MSIYGKSYTQGIYNPTKPEKCININGAMGSKCNTITYRSSWELKFMKFCDKYDSILEWGSEVLKVPYIQKPFILTKKLFDYNMIKGRNNLFKFCNIILSKRYIPF